MTNARSSSQIISDLKQVITIGYYGGPIFLFELTIGSWLIIKSLRPGTLTASA